MRRHILRDVAAATDRIDAFLRSALDAESLLDHRLWLRIVADAIAAEPDATQLSLFEHAARRIRAA
jgi:hypothetical protein